MLSLNTIHYVYCHFRNDTDEVFYVGKGQKKRAYSKQRRNPYWNNIVNKAKGFRVEIVAHNLTEQEALNYERVLISALRQQYPDTLCNLTDGGDGVYNPSEETREKQRTAKLGRKLSEEHRQKISLGNKNRIVTEETKEKLRQVQLGRTSPFKGIKRDPEIGKKISASKLGTKYKRKT
jgi:hypothetical protein